ncbi:hypothetical protein L7F22_016125 [Adiantum nelumboides]|nr:hypothetical protein [Adiantum nelumboides]
MIGPILAKLYGAVSEEELSSLAEGEGMRTPGHAGFCQAFSTIDHIFTLRCLIDQTRVRKRRLYSCFVDFRKAFDTVPRERLFRRLAALGIGEEMTWGIYTLYEHVSGRVRCPGGLSDTLVSTIGVKQGCPLSPTLFGLYIDEIVDFILHQGGEGVDIAGTTVYILLYADDIVLVSETAEGLQHLQALDDFCSQRTHGWQDQGSHISYIGSDSPTEQIYSSWRRYRGDRLICISGGYIHSSIGDFLHDTGKAGVTESLANAISDALEAKEILKLKVLDNCPDELDVVISKIEEATQGQVVGKIGSVITLYRPSLRKLSETPKSQNKGQEGRPRRTMGRRV